MHSAEQRRIFFCLLYCLGALPHQTKHEIQPCVRLSNVIHWGAFSCGEPEESCEATHVVQKARENKLLKAFEDKYKPQAEIKIW